MLTVKIKCSRAIEWRAIQCSSVRRCRPFTRPCKGRNDSGHGIDNSNTMIPDVADIETAFVIQYDGMRLIQLRGCCRTTVSRKTGSAIASQS